MTATDAYELSDAATARLIDVLGSDGVLLTQEARDEYRDPFWHPEDRTYDSSAVVLPTDTVQVQAVVRVANEMGIPLWTSSQGRNNGYGGPSPRVRGSVLVSLRRMNRVLEINSELAYAVVEPGVTYFQLREALDASGNEELWFSIPDLGWGSVIGNSLDNGVTYAPYGSDWQKLCGMEVVLPDGELLRTGMGALPQSSARHVYPRGFGPVFDPIFFQSNYGIVTNVAVWLMRRPEAFAPLFLTIPRNDQLASAIDIVRELRLDGVIRGVPTIQNIITMTAQFDETRAQYRRTDPALPEAELQRLGDQTGLGRWGLRTALWGDAPVVEHHLARLRAAWSAIDGGRVDSKRIFGRDEWDQISTFVEKVQAGIPTLDIITRTPDYAGHMAFAPALPLRGEEVASVVAFSRRVIEEEVGTNHTCAIFAVNDRSSIIVNSLGFDVRDESAVRQVRATLRRLITEAAALGYGEYRGHIDLMDIIADQLSFNDHIYRRFAEAIKDAIDPAGVLSPGRSGIWPERFRA